MSTTTGSISSKEQGFPVVGWAVSLILVVAGLVALFVQFSQGLAVTGISQQITWGLYIAGFFTAAAGGAGLLTYVALGEFRPLFPMAARPKLLAMALAGFVTSGLLILTDIGAPLQLWRLITAFRFTAFTTIDFWVLAAAVVITLLMLRGPSRTLAVLAILASAALIVVESLMLSGLAAHPMWGGLTTFSFLVSAVIAGVSLALLVLPASEAAKPLLTTLAWALGIGLALVLAELLVGLVGGNIRTTAEARSLVAGTASPFFWFHILIGAGLPLALILGASARKPTVWIASLSLLGVLAYKLWLLVAGQELPWVSLPSGSYFPTWVELLVLAGTVALGVIVYHLLTRMFNTRSVT